MVEALGQVVVHGDGPAIVTRPSYHPSRFFVHQVSVGTAYFGISIVGFPAYS